MAADWALTSDGSHTATVKLLRLKVESEGVTLVSTGVVRGTCSRG